MILYAQDWAEFVAAASLWKDILSEGFDSFGLALGPPPCWLSKFAVPAPVDVQAVSEVGLQPKLARCLKARSMMPQEIVRAELSRASRWSTPSRKVFALRPELAWLATALAMLWDHGTRRTTVAVLNQASLAGHLEGCSEAILVAEPHEITHDRLDAWLPSARKCQFGILTGRNTRDITWQWHKPVLWNRLEGRQCVSIDWEKRTVVLWRPGYPQERKEAASIRMLDELMPKSFLLCSLMGHGSGIDMDLAGVGVLCGRTLSALEAVADDHLAPACASADAPCHRDAGGQRRIIPADKLAASLLFANTCRGVGLAKSTYSANFSLALGVLDGSTGSLVSAHRLRLIDRQENAFVESCVEAGMSSGAITRQLNELLTERSEPPAFALLGRPDHRPLRIEEALPVTTLRWGAEPLTLPRSANVCMVQVSGAPRAMSAVREIAPDQRSGESPPSTVYGSATASGFVMYSGSAAWKPVELCPSSRPEEEAILCRWWRALCYLRMYRPLIRDVLDEGSMTKLNEHLVLLEETLLEGSTVLDVRTRGRIPDLGRRVITGVAAEVERISQFLARILDAMLQRHGSFLVYRSMPQMTRTAEEQASKIVCGCGARLRWWHVSSSVSSDVERWQWECSTCGVVLDSPRKQNVLRFVGPIDLNAGEKQSFQWVWNPSLPSIGTPRLYIALRHSVCESRSIKISTNEAKYHGEHYIFDCEIEVGPNQTAETYWLNAIVLSNLELTYALQRIRVLRTNNGAGTYASSCN